MSLNVEIQCLLLFPLSSQKREPRYGRRNRGRGEGGKYSKAVLVYFDNRNA
jgi:hypothetical protein